MELSISIWKQKGKINCEKPEIIDALYGMGYSIDPRWEYDAISIFRGIADEEDIREMEEYAKTPIAQLFAGKRWREIENAAKHSEKLEK